MQTEYPYVVNLNFNHDHNPELEAYEFVRSFSCSAVPLASVPEPMCAAAPMQSDTHNPSR